LDVGATLSGWLPSLDSLHRGFALVQKYSLGIANVGQAPERFTLGGSRCQLSDERIGAYRNQVAGELVNRGVIGDGSEFAGLSKQIFPSRLPSLKHISGKFLLRLWFHRMKLCGLIGNVSQDSLLIRCARTSKLRRLRSVRTRVNRYVSGRLTDRKAVK
jgi:hypothetical protein